MKNSFGEIKSKTLKKLTELYENNNKEEIKEFLSLIFENKDFQELYLFYDEAENLHLEYPGTAEAYVDDIQPLLKEKIKNIQETCEKLSKYLKDVVVENNELYDNLDILLETTTINNLDKKVIAKRKLIDFFSEKKILQNPKRKVLLTTKNYY